jgi:hypothetical protein
LSFISLRCRFDFRLFAFIFAAFDSYYVISHCRRFSSDNDISDFIAFDASPPSAALLLIFHAIVIRHAAAAFPLFRCQRRRQLRYYGYFHAAFDYTPAAADAIIYADELLFAFIFIDITPICHFDAITPLADAGFDRVSLMPLHFR